VVEDHSFEFLSGRLNLDQINADITEENAGDTWQPNGAKIEKGERYCSLPCHSRRKNYENQNMFFYEFSL